MEDSEKEILSQVQGNLKEILQELYNEQKSRLGDLTQWSPQRLIIYSQSFEFWCVDALIRLIGLVEGKILDWLDIYRRVEKIAIGLTIEDLAKLYLQTHDAESVKALALLHIDVEAIQGEIQRRREPLRMGKAFSYLIDNKLDESALVSVLNITGENIFGLCMGWPLSPGKKDMLEALREGKYASRKEDHEKLKSDVLCKILDFYSQLQEAIELGNIDAIPFSMVGIFRPVNNPAWEEKAPSMLKEMIEDVTRIRLPILDGSMEEAPRKVYNSHRTEDRRGFITYKHQKVCKKCGGSQLDDSPSCPDCGGDWEEKKVGRSLLTRDRDEEDENYIEEEHDRFNFRELKTEIISNGYGKNKKYDVFIKPDWLVREEKEEEMIKPLFREEIFELIKASFVKKTKTNRKVIKALELILFKEWTEQEAIKEVKLPPRTWSDYSRKFPLKLKL